MDPIIKSPGGPAGTVRIGAPRAVAPVQPPGGPVSRPGLARHAAPDPAARPPAGTAIASAMLPAAAGAAALPLPAPAVPARSDALAQELEQLRAAARLAGYEEGKEEGKAAGLQEGQAAAQRELATLGRSLRDVLAASLGGMREAHVRFQAELEQACVDIAFAATVQVFGRLSARHDAVHQAVLRAMEQAGALAEPQIRLHPDDAQALAPLLQLPPDGGPADRRGAWALCPDASVGRGGCIIGSPQGDIDARLETQLQNLAALLQRHRHAAVAEALPAAGEPS
jgi:flagellar assembly protein FliH